MIIRTQNDDRYTQDTIYFNIITYLIPVYSSPDPKVLKCINLPLLMDWGNYYNFQTNKVATGNFDTFFLAIVPEDFLYLARYNNKEIQSTLKRLFKKEISKMVFIKSFKYPIIDLKNNQTSYFDSTSEYSYLTQKLTPTSYKISEKDHNYNSVQLLDFHNGILSLDYHWEKIVDFEIFLSQEIWERKIKEL